MKQIKESVAESCFQDPSIQAVIALDKDQLPTSITAGRDLLFLIITSDEDRSNYTTYYIKDNYTIQERWITTNELKQVIRGYNQHMMPWIAQGEIILDRETYMEDLRDRIKNFPELHREARLLEEFTIFISKYLNSKDDLRKGYILDAYTNILSALKHWAHIVIIEEGMYPELSVWNQVHQVNSGVYKLYEELTHSQETLEQRIQLVLLACEFSIMSKMESCCRLLIRILKGRSEPWSLNELVQHQELISVQNELPMLLKHLYRKSLVREVAVPVSKDVDTLEIRYTV